MRFFQAQDAPKIDGGWRFTPDPTAGAYSAPPDLLTGCGEKDPGDPPPSPYILIPN